MSKFREAYAAYIQAHEDFLAAKDEKEKAEKEYQRVFEIEQNNAPPIDTNPPANDVPPVDTAEFMLRVAREDISFGKVDTARKRLESARHTLEERRQAAESAAYQEEMEKANNANP